jgi:hypothetical protein
MSSPGAERKRVETCFEFVTYGALPDDCRLPARPGQVSRDADGRPALLHFAPRRWLVVSPGANLKAGLADLDDRGLGALVDVDEKWLPLRVGEPSKSLGTCIAAGAVLRDRQCAAVSIFDCPAIIAGGESGIDLWVASSFVDTLRAAFRETAHTAK